MSMIFSPKSENLVIGTLIMNPKHALQAIVSHSITAEHFYDAKSEKTREENNRITPTQSRRINMPNQWSREDLLKLEPLSNREAVTILQQLVACESLNNWEADTFPKMLKKFREGGWEASEKQSASIRKGACDNISGYEPDGQGIKPKEEKV